MITRITVDLTDDERRIISGKRAPATRKQINDYVERLVSRALGRESVDGTHEVGPLLSLSSPSLSCTSLDHLYPSTTKGTPCFCGKRQWGVTTSTR